MRFVFTTHDVATEAAVVVLVTVGSDHYFMESRLMVVFKVLPRRIVI